MTGRAVYGHFALHGVTSRPHLYTALSFLHFDHDIPELAVSVPNPGNLVRTNKEDYIIEVESYIGV